MSITTGPAPFERKRPDIYDLRKAGALAWVVLTVVLVVDIARDMANP